MNKAIRNMIINPPKKYILNQIKSSVAAYSLDQLNVKAKSCGIFSFSDASPVYTGKWKNGSLDKDDLASYIARNRILSPSMTVDTNVDGVVDNWTKNNGAGVTATFSLDTVQKIEITASGAPSTSTYVFQDIAIIAGEIITFKGTMKISGNVTGRVVVQCLDSADTVLSTTTTTFTDTSYIEKSVANLIAPPTTTKVKCILGILQNADGNVGSAWFKDASMVKVVAFTLDDTMSVDGGSGVPLGWLRSYTNASGTHSIDYTEKCQKIILTNVSAINGNIKTSYRISGFQASENVSFMFDYKVSITAGTFNAHCYLVALDSSDGVLGTSADIANMSSTSWVTVSATYSNLPVNTAKVEVRLTGQSYTDITGRGSVYFKNVKVYRSNVSAYVQQLTDQSDNGNHAIQNTQANQPRVLNNGIWETDVSGKLRIIQTATTNLVKTGVSISNIFSCSYVGNTMQNVSARLNALTSEIPANNTMIIPSCGTGNPPLLSIGERLPNIYLVNQSNISDYINTPLILSYNRISTTNQEVYKNGGNKLTDSNITVTFNITRIYLGADTTAGNNFLQEFIIFAQPLTDSQRQKLEKNQGKRYNIALA